MAKELTTAQKGYGGRWQRARAEHLRRHPLCEMCCALLPARLTPATVVDHRIPHRLADALKSGDQSRIASARRLFWDQGNWSSLCKTHHDSDKQMLEKSGRHKMAFDASGEVIWDR